MSTYLIDVRTLDLRHCDEVVCQKQPIVLPNAAHFRQALVTVEEKLLAHILQLLRLLSQHEAERLLLVQEQLLFSADQIVLVSFEAPARDVLRLEQLFLSLYQMPLLLDKVLLDLLSQC